MLRFIDKEIGSPRATLDPFLIGEHEPKYERQIINGCWSFVVALGFKGHID
jgi:hypothetical protein